MHTPYPSSPPLHLPHQWSGGTNYAQAGRRTVSSVASVLLPILPELDHLRGVFRLENLGLEELSFGAYVSALNHAFEGMCYPRRGYAAVAAAFVPTVRAAGGAVLTKAPVKSITLSADGKVGGWVGPGVGGALVMERGRVVRLSRGLAACVWCGEADVPVCVCPMHTSRPWA